MHRRIGKFIVMALVALSVAMFTQGCGSTKPTTPMTPSATQATTVAVTEAVETEVPEPNEEVPEEYKGVTAEDFEEIMTMLLSDSEVAPDDVTFTYKDAAYSIHNLSELYAALVLDDGGTVTLSAPDLDETEELPIDFDELATMKEMLDSDLFSEPMEDEDAYAWYDGPVDDSTIARYSGSYFGTAEFSFGEGKYEEYDKVNAAAKVTMYPDSYTVMHVALDDDDINITNESASYISFFGSINYDATVDGVQIEGIPVEVDEDGNMTFSIYLDEVNIDFALTKDSDDTHFEEVANSHGFTDYLMDTEHELYDPDAEPETEAEPEETEPETEAEDFGKTTADATGIISESKIRSGYKSLIDTFDKFAGTDTKITYEAVRDIFGTDGEKDTPLQWREDSHRYQWKTEDEKIWVIVIFDVDTDGNETLHIINQSNNLIE